MNKLFIATAAGALLTGVGGTPALAQDWSGGNPVTGTVGFMQYVAVDGNGDPVMDNTQINADGTFKDTCAGCSWVQGNPTGPDQAQYQTPYAWAGNPATGSSAFHSANGSTFANVDGFSTIVVPAGLITNGVVRAGHVVSEGVVVSGESYVSTFSGNAFTGGSAEVGTTLTSYGAALVDHGDRIGAAEGRIVTLQTDLGTLTGRVDAHGAVLDDHGSRIGTLETTVDVHTVVIGDHGERIGVLETTVEEHGATLVDHGSRLDGHDAALSNHEGRIVTLRTDLGTLQGVVDEHGTVLDDHGKKIGSLQDTVDGHQVVLDDHGTRIGTLETTVGEHGTTLADHGGRITTVEQRADGVDTRLNQFNRTGGSVENWATGVDATLGDHGGAISDLYGITNAQGLAIAGLTNVTSAHSAQIASLRSDMKTVQGGVALALALDVPHLEAGKRFGFAANLADFDGTGAFAGGIALRLDQNWQVNAGGGFGFNGGANGGKVGVTGQW